MPWRSARRRGEQGAIAVFLALTTVFMLLPLSGLVLDIGMQRVARRDAQSVADLSAMDAARALATGTTTNSGVTSVASASAARQVGEVGDGAPVVKAYVGHLTNVFVSDQSLGCASSPYNQYFTSSGSANAVLVVVSNQVDYTIMGGKGNVCRSSIASTVSTSCYDVGSYAAAVSTGHSALLNPLFQQIAQQSGAFSNGATVMAIDYKGLAQSQIDLTRMATDLGFASPTQLATATVKLGDFYAAMIDAMVVPQNSTNLTALQALKATASSTATVAMGKILSFSAGTGSMATATMNALDLVGGSLALLNGSRVASVNVSSGLPGIANANAQVTLIQGPHHFCGPVGSTATTSTDPSLTQQLGVSMTATINPVTQAITVPAIAGLLASTTATVQLPNNVTTKVSVAPTSTTLTGITCAGSSGITLDVNNALATVSIDTYLSNIVVNANLLNLTVLGIPIASLNAKISVNAHVQATATLSPSGTYHMAITVPPQQFDTAYPSTSTGVGLGTPTFPDTPSIQVQSNATIAGLIYAGSQVSLSSSQLSSILNDVVSAVITPMFDTTNANSFVSTVVNPVLGLLGTDVGGADITLDSKPALSCSQPVTKG